MTPEFWVQIVALVVTLLISFAGAIWVGGIYFSKQFREIRDSNHQEFTHLKLELNTVSTTVSPYAQDISRLTNQQQTNSLDIAALKSLGTRVDSIQRQLENLQKK